MSYNKQSWNQDILLQPQADDADALLTSGTYAAGTLALDGALTDDGVYVNTYTPFLTWTCDGDETSNTLTITGKDQAGRTYSITVDGVNNDVVIIEVPFYSIDSDGIVLENDSASTMSIGTSEQLSTVWIPVDQSVSGSTPSMTCTISSGGVLNYTVQTTQDNALNELAVNIQNDTILANETASGVTYFDISTKFIRVIINSWTSGTLLNQFVQSAAFHGYKNY